MKAAVEAAKIERKNIRILEVYDQSTVMEMIALEDLGFVERGTAWKHLYESFQDFNGYYELDGHDVYVNLNGGLKADGNPLGATGGAQIYEVFKQLREEAAERQVKVDDSCLGCVLELEGFGTKAYVHIFGRNPP